MIREFAGSNPARAIFNSPEFEGIRIYFTLISQRNTYKLLVIMYKNNDTNYNSIIQERGRRPMELHRRHIWEASERHEHQGYVAFPHGVAHCYEGRESTMRPPAWSADENAHLIDLRNSGLTGDRLHIAFQILFPSRTGDAIKKHIQMLRWNRRMR